MSRKNPDAHKDLLKRAFQREEAGGVTRYVYHHDDRYYFVLAACARLDLDFEARSDRLIVPADIFEQTVLGGEHIPMPSVASESVFAPVEHTTPDDAAPSVSAEPTAVMGAADDAVYEEEEFVFNHSDADAATEGTDTPPAELAVSPQTMQMTVSPFFMLDDEGRGAVPDAPANTPSDDTAEDDETEEFVFLTADDDEVTELRWDDSTAPVETMDHATDHATGVTAWDDEDDDALVATDFTIADDGDAETPGQTVDDETDTPDSAPEEVVSEAVPDPLSEDAFRAEPEPPAPPAPQLTMAQIQDNALTKRTEGAQVREQALLDRERAISDREKSVVLREEATEDRRKDMARRERRVERRRKDLEALERKLKTRQQYLDSQRAILDGLREAAREIVEGG